MVMPVYKRLFGSTGEGLGRAMSAKAKMALASKAKIAAAANSVRFMTSPFG
jgi:hypothetical protein